MAQRSEIVLLLNQRECTAFIYTINNAEFEEEFVVVDILNTTLGK